MTDEFLIGDTAKLTWVNSGVTPDAAPPWSLYDGGETVVDTGTLISSGNGHYYGYCTLPDTPGFYVAESIATISGFPFKRRVRLRAILDEVD